MHPGRSGRRGLAVLAVAMALRAWAQPAADEVTVLDPVFVEASTGTPWRYAATADFEVLSHCPDKFNAAYVRALQAASAAREALLPARFWGDVPTPMALILYNREPAQLDGFRSRSPIDLAWTQEMASTPDSILMTHPLVIGDGDSYLSCGNYWGLVDDTKDLTVDPDSEARLAQRAPRLPAWFVTGLTGPAGLYLGHRIIPSAHGNTLVLAEARWTTAAETQALRAAAARQKKEKRAPVLSPLLLPLEDLFTGKVPNGQDDLWNAEAALLVRWGLYASGERDGFLRVVDAAASAPLSEGVLQRELHLSSQELRHRLVGYLLAAVAQPIEVGLPDLAPAPVVLRDAKPAEVDRILGDWGRLEGRSLGLQDADYQNECLDQADKLFQHGHQSRTHDPRFLASYGLYELQRGDKTRAREALEEAVGAGVVRPKAYAELARLRLEAALPMYPRGRGDLAADDLDNLLDLLEIGRRQMPSLQVTYQVMARAWDYAPANPTRGELLPLREALRLFPRDVPFAHRVAKLYAVNGYRDEAVAIVDGALPFASSEAERSFLSSVTRK